MNYSALAAILFGLIAYAFFFLAMVFQPFDPLSLSGEDQQKLFYERACRAAQWGLIGSAVTLLITGGPN